MVDAVALLAGGAAERRAFMTVPMDYLYASRDFRRFLDAVVDAIDQIEKARAGAAA